MPPKPPQRAVVLGELQGWVCPICGEPMDPEVIPSIDHVHPRRGKQGRTGLYRNALASHGPCNNRKGDRDPTGCELIWLDAINARLAEVPPPQATRQPTLADLWPTSLRPGSSAPTAGQR